MRIRFFQFLSLGLICAVLLLPSVSYAAQPAKGTCIDGADPASDSIDGSFCFKVNHTATADVCVDSSTYIVKGFPSAAPSYTCASPYVPILNGKTSPTTITPPPPPKPIPDPKPGTTPGAVTCSGTTSGGLCIPENPACVGGNSDSIACGGSADIVGLLATIIKTMLFFAGIVAVIFIIIGGYRYMTSAGSEEGAKKGRATLTNALIGLVIVIMAYAIVLAITSFLTT